MRRRLYFIVPDPTLAHRVVDELLLARVEARHMHVIAREGVPLGDLPTANLLQRSDLKEAVGHGLTVGGALGALVGLIIINASPAGEGFGGGLVAAMALAGAGFGAWMSSMIGVSVRNRELRKFDSAIEHGELLMMVDVPKEQVEDIQQRVRSHHPGVEFGGIEPNKPAFP